MQYPPQLSDRFIADLEWTEPDFTKAARTLNAITVEFCDAFASRIEVPVCSATVDADGKSLAKHIQGHLAAAHFLLGARMAELLSDLVVLLNGQRVASCALTGRAIIETAGAAITLEEHVKHTAHSQELDRRSRLRSLLGDLHRSIAGGRFDWTSVGTGDVAMLDAHRRSEPREPPEEQKAINVLTMVRKLDRRLHRRLAHNPVPGVQGGAVLAVYSMLSDFCHPATGTVILHSRRLQDGVIGLEPTPGERGTRWFFSNLGAFIAPAAACGRDALVELHRLAEELGAGSATDH